MDCLNSKEETCFTETSACKFMRKHFEEGNVMSWFRFLAVTILVSCATISSPVFGQSVFEDFLNGRESPAPPKPKEPRELPIAGKTTFDFTFTDDVTVFRFSPDGQWIAVGLIDGTVRLRGEKGGPGWKSRIFESAVTDLRFSPDGRQITAYSAHQNVVRTWGISPTGEPSEKILASVTLNKPWQRTQSVISLDGQYVALVGNQSTRLERDSWGNWGYAGVPSPFVRVYHARTGKLLSRFRPKGGHASSSQMFFGPVGSGTLLVVPNLSASDDSAQVWEFNNPQPIDPKHTFPIRRGRSGLANDYYVYAGKDNWLIAKNRNSNHGISISPEADPEADIATMDLEVIDWSTGKRSTLHPSLPLLSDLPSRYYHSTLNVSYFIEAAVLAPQADRIAVLTNYSDDSLNSNGAAVLFLMDMEGKIIGAIPGVGKIESNLTFSPDGTRLAASSGKRVRFWELSLRPSTGSGDLSNNTSESQKPRRNLNWSAEEGGTLKGHTEIVRSIAFSPDGTTLASGSDDNTIKLWSLQTGVVRQTLTGHGGEVNSIAFSPDGKMLASGSDDRTIKLWDPHMGNLDGTLKNHSDSVRMVAFSPDGKLLLSKERENGPIKLWDTQTGNLEEEIEDGIQFIGSIVFSPDGRTLVWNSSTSGDTKFWDIKAGKRKPSIYQDRNMGEGLTFSPDGKTLVSVSSSTASDLDRITVFGPGSTRDSSHSIIKLWDTQTGKIESLISTGDETTHSIAFSPDSKTLVSLGGESSLSYPSESTIKLWDTQTGNLKGMRTVRIAYGIDFSPDGRMLALYNAWGGDKTAIRLFKVSTVKPPPAPTPQPPPSFAGEWDVPSGPLALTVRGNQVTGSYPFFGGRVEGLLSKDGKSVTGTFTQSNGYTGSFVFKLSPDSKQIEGRRWAGNKMDDGTGGPWSGERIGNPVFAEVRPAEPDGSLEDIQAEPEQTQQTNKTLDVERPVEAVGNGHSYESVTGAPGQIVEVAWEGNWYKATILKVTGENHFSIHYNGWSDSWDEIVGAERIRKPQME